MLPLLLAAAYGCAAVAHLRHWHKSSAPAPGEEVEEEMELPKKGHPSRLRRAKAANAQNGRKTMHNAPEALPTTYELDM